MTTSVQKKEHPWVQPLNNGSFKLLRACQVGLVPITLNFAVGAAVVLSKGKVGLSALRWFERPSVNNTVTKLWYVSSVGGYAAAGGLTVAHFLKNKKQQ